MEEGILSKKARRQLVAWAVTGVLLATGLTVSVRRSTGLSALTSWLIAANVVTLVLYAFDKLTATQRWPRVPEKALHFMAIVGGTPAAMLAMRVFRHKSAKSKFRRVFWLILLVQIIAIVLFFALADRWKRRRRAPSPETLENRARLVPSRPASDPVRALLRTRAQTDRPRETIPDFAPTLAFRTLERPGRAN